MLNKIFYFVSIITILGFNFIDPYCCAHAHTITVLYGSTKTLKIIPGYAYTVKVLGVGIKTSDGVKWDAWKHKNDCYIRSQYDNNPDKQDLYKKQAVYPVVYSNKTGQQIVFQFLKTKPYRQPAEPENIVCQIEIIAYDVYGQPISDAVKGSHTQKTMHEDTILDSKEQNQEQKNAASLFTNTSPIEESDDPLIGYGANEEADYGCCGRKKSKKRPYGIK